MNQFVSGFSDCQFAYSPYPNALLAVRFVNEVGKIVIGDSPVEPGEVKEGDAHSFSQKSAPRRQLQRPTSRSDRTSDVRYHA